MTNFLLLSFPRTEKFLTIFLLGMESFLSISDLGTEKLISQLDHFSYEAYLKM